MASHNAIHFTNTVEMVEPFIKWPLTRVGFRSDERMMVHTQVLALALTLSLRLLASTHDPWLCLTGAQLCALAQFYTEGAQHYA